MRSIILLTSLMFSQTLLAFNMEWGKLTQKEIDYSLCEFDKEAGAVILGSLGKYTVDMYNNELYYNLETHIRIKILNDKGMDHANCQIRFYHKDQGEIITGIGAHTIAPDQSITTVSETDFHTEKIDDFFSKMVFAFPNAKPGSIIEYKFHVKSKYILNPRTWYFQHDLPVEKSAVTFISRSIFDYVYMNSGKDFFKETVAERKLGDNNAYQIYLSKEKLPALKEEAYITTMDDYFNKVAFQLRKYYLDGMAREIFTTWADVKNEVLSSAGLGQNLDRKSLNSKLLKSAKEHLNNWKSLPLNEQLRQVNHWVKSNVAFNGELGIYTDQTINECWKLGRANGAARNLMSILIMRKLGHKVSPILLSTRGHGSMIPEYPILGQFNHTAGILETKDKSIFIDLIDDHCPTGQLSQYSLNGKALVLDEEPRWIKVSPPLSKVKYEFNIQVSSNGGAQINGVSESTNYLASKERNFVNYQDQDGLLMSRCKDAFGEINIDSISQTNKDDNSLPYNENFSIIITKYGEQVEDLLILPPFPITIMEENPFTLTKRYYPIEYNYYKTHTFKSTISIPDGYQIEELPKGFDHSIRKGEIVARCAYRELGGEIHCYFNLMVKTTSCPRLYYPELQDAYADIVNIKDASIVLIKKE